MLIPLILIGLLIFGAFLAWSIMRWRLVRLSSAAKFRIRRQWEQVLHLTDPHRKILEADAVLDAVLKELGYQGSLGEKLRRAATHVRGLEEVWFAHKLRNRIAHEPGTTVNGSDAARAMQAYEGALERFLR